MITRVYVDNYRCFSAFELRPERMNLLMGLNGGGKTSLLAVLAGLTRNLRSGAALSAIFPASELTRWDKRTTQRFEVDVALGDRDYRYLLVLEQEPETSHTSLVEEKVTCSGAVLFRYDNGHVHLHGNDGREGTSFPFRAARSFLPEIEVRPETRLLMDFLDYFGRTRVLKLLPGAISSQSGEESDSLDSDGSDFASWYRNLSQERPGDLHDLFSNLADVMPGFHSLALVGAGNQGRTRELIARFNSPTNGTYDVGFGELSDGQRVLVVLYALLLELREGTRLLLLDEPENYVGLTEIQPWLLALDEALGDTGQLLLISHHPEVIDLLAAHQALVFERQGGGPVRAVAASFDREGGLKASEQIARGFVGAR